MNKKILFILSILSILIPFNIYALTATPEISCESTKIKKNEEVKCKITANITDGPLEGFKASIDDPNSYFISGVKSITKSETFQNGKKVILEEFTLKAGDKSGEAVFNITNITDGNNNPLSVASLSQTIRILNNNSNLNDIKINGESINGFTSTKTNGYDLSVNKKTINIEAAKSDANATVKGTGETILSCGDNKREIKVEAEDKTTKVYTLNIKRTCSDVSTLKGITISSGILSPNFDKDTKEYKVDVSKDTDKITITPIKTDEQQEVKGDIGEKELKFGKNTFKIEVVSEKGTTTTYKLIVTREDSRDGNRYLSSIKLSSGKIMFDKEKYEYNTKVLYDVTSITVDAKAESATSKVVVVGNKNLTVGKNTIIIKVTSENDESTNYKINVTRLNEGETLGNNANLSSIEIGKYKLKFDPNKTEYILEIKDETKLNISVTPEDETSVYKIVGNSNLKNKSVIKIIVEALDDTTKTYKITIKKTSNKIPLIILGSSIFVAIVLITIIIIANKNKNKKDEEEVAIKKVKTKVIKKDDKELLEKVNKQLDILDQEDELEKLNEYVPEPVIEEAKVEEVKEEHSDTKTCPLCGHKIAYDSAICPYCRKKF